MPFVHVRVTAVAACVVLGACHTSAPASTAPEPVAIRTDAAAIEKARADSVRKPYTAADVHFMSGMIGHHAQAIAMARWASTHGASQSIQTLAGRIINAQTDEIHLMQQWLADRRQVVPEPDPRGLRMTMNGMEHMMLMPGMLSAEQMKELDAARGADFDRKFLRFMMQHHNGAVEMVRELFGSYGAGIDDTVFKFASDVNVDQTTEIARMERMLAAMTP